MPANILLANVSPVTKPNVNEAEGDTLPQKVQYIGEDECFWTIISSATETKKEAHLIFPIIFLVP